MSEHAINGGGFADIYLGKYLGKEVAVKVLRVFNTREQQEILKAGPLATLSIC